MKKPNKIKCFIVLYPAIILVVFKAWRFNKNTEGEKSNEFYNQPPTANLIFVSFAHDISMRLKTNVNENLTESERIGVYMQNACVALVSAKHYNPECDVALVTNLEDKYIPKDIRNIFSHQDIKIFHIPFDEFKFGSEVHWGLAFYKLCALYHIVRETNYENFLYMDTDVYVQGTLAPIFDEVQENILLYDINHGLKVPNYIKFLEEVRNFYPDKKIITQYGGEFFAACRKNAIKFIELAHHFFNKIISSNVTIESGDEAILSVCADKLKDSIRNSGAYIFRFWTYSGFRLVSTCYQYNPITILHVPSEKEGGFLEIYRKHVAIGKLPDNQQVWKILRISTASYSEPRFRRKVKLLLKKLFFFGNAH